MVNTKTPRRRRPPVRRREQQSARTKQEIIEAALRVIAVHGFREATIDLISEAAEVSPTSIYWHFGNREGLLLALAEHIARTYYDAYRARVPDGAAPEEQVRGYVAAILELASTRPDVVRAQIALNTEGTTMPALREGIRPLVREMRAPFAAMIDANVAAGRFLPMRGSIWLDYFLGSVQGAVIQAGLRRDGFDSGELLAAVGRAALASLGLSAEGATSSAEASSPRSRPMRALPQGADASEVGRGTHHPTVVQRQARAAQRGP